MKTKEENELLRNANKSLGDLLDRKDKQLKTIKVYVIISCITIAITSYIVGIYDMFQ